MQATGVGGRSGLLAAGAGVLLVVALAAPVLARGQVAGSSPAPSPGRGAELVSRVPDAISGDCTLAGTSDAGEVAAVDCVPTDASITRLSYRQFVDADSLAAAFAGSVANAAGQRGGGADCRVGPSVVQWKNDDGSIGGALACADGTDSRTTFAWTDTSLLIMAEADSSGDFSTTYDWWLGAGPEGPPPPTTPPGPTSFRTGDVIYDAGDFSTWGATGSWALASGGLLAYDGSYNGSDSVFAPVELPVQDYVLEVELQVPPQNGNEMGLLVRAGDDGSELIKIGYGSVYIGEDTRADLDVQDGKWHTWRVSAVSNEYEVSIDGKRVVQAVDNAHLNGATVGLYGYGTQFAARNLKVLAP